LKVLGRVTGRGQFRRERESEAPIVAVIADEGTSVRSPRAQASKTGFDEARAHAAPLKRGLDRHGAQGIPAVQRRWSYGGEGHMPDHLAAHHGHQREDESIGPPQAIHNA